VLEITRQATAAAKPGKDAFDQRLYNVAKNRLLLVSWTIWWWDPEDDLDADVVNFDPTYDVRMMLPHNQFDRDCRGLWPP
jgi:hypothetical protein